MPQNSLSKSRIYFDYELWNTCHDNGSEFEKEFQDAVTKLGLGDYWSRVATPTDNPFNKRFKKSSLTLETWLTM